jgi:Cof subfamily protein (haloacid dehalogenase superfamily)
VSDVDGTLVTDDKRLTQGTVSAVRRLGEAGIRFAVVSSRPPFGMRMLVEPLRLTTPLLAFNGGAVVTPGLDVLQQHLLAPDAARRAIGMIAACGADIWLFTAERWFVLDPNRPYVAREIRTAQAEPVTVPNFDPMLGAAGKIVGVSADFDLLARCEAELRPALDGQANAVRSQPYYLDVTHPSANKGAALRWLAGHLGIPHAEIATIGDGDNDVAMFRESGFSIAMGNGRPAAKAAAMVVTGGNGEDGFAQAVDRYLLARPAAEGARP